ncbi:MAG: hypothetical protein AB8B71_09085 [Paracoccaceae bacterium]
MGLKRKGEFRQVAARIALTSGLTRKKVADDDGGQQQVGDNSGGRKEVAKFPNH